MPSDADATRALFASEEDADLIGLASQQGLVHNWDRDGFGPVMRVIMTQDGVQAFTTHVVNGKGIVVGPEAPGNHREAFLRKGTFWKDGEVTSIVWGPTLADGTPADWASNNAQQGHWHRVREFAPGQWEGIAVWTSVFGGDYSVLTFNAVRFTGSPAGVMPQGAGLATGADVAHIDRATRIIGHERFQFISDWINQYTLLQPERLRTLLAGEHIAITNLADATFNEADKAVVGAVGANGTISVQELTTLSASAYVASAGGQVAPVGVSLQRRYVPFVLKTRVIGGTPSSVPVEAMRYRLGEPPPDWGDPRVIRTTVNTDADMPSVATEAGFHGWWHAHYYDDSGGAFGETVFKNVAGAAG